MRALTFLSLLSLVACKGGGDDTGPIDDGDGDGFGASEDCDDDNASVNPDAEEIAYDGVDNDCSADTPDNDLDGDGYLAVDDCDDQDAAVNTGATEVCDGVDNDCDGVTDGEGAEGATTWYADLDQDGFGEDETTTEACDAPSLYVADSGDCNDGDDTIHPDGEETCDDEDQDCDGQVDEDAADGEVYYYDADLDGYGDDKDTDSFCESNASPVWSLEGGDCEPDDVTVNPGAVEVCDGLDNDCNDAVDDDAADAVIYYADADADGFGDAAAKEGTASCEAVSGTATNQRDCDDGDKSVNPFAEEVCGDGVDQDCDGADYEGETWYADADGDGYGDEDDAVVACDEPSGYGSASGDCDDEQPRVNPGEAEVCGNGIDDNCDDAATGCTLEGDIPASGALSISATDTYFGWDFDLADFDDDGQEDLAIATPYGPASNTGSVYLYNGPITADLGASDAWARLGGDADELAGTGVVNIGDIDGDGLDDLAVGAYLSASSYADGGAVYLVTGALTGSGALSDHWLVSPGGEADVAGTGSYLGWAMAPAGDVNEDRSDDFWVSAAYENAGYALGDDYDNGAVYLFAGPVTGSVGVDDAEATILGDATGDALGTTLNTGDTDGDGVDDVLIGAAGAATVYLHDGAASGELASSDLDVAFTGDGAGTFGYDADVGGDLNDDGYADVVVGDYDLALNHSSGGAVYVFHGPFTGDLTDADADGVIGSVEDTQYVGEVVAHVGDLDGDGVGDLALGNSYQDSLAEDAGSAFLFQGPVTGTLDTSDAWGAVQGSTTYEYLGWPKTGAADDLTGDGYPDLLVGSPYTASTVYIVPSGGNAGL